MGKGKGKHKTTYPNIDQWRPKGIDHFHQAMICHIQMEKMPPKDRRTSWFNRPYMFKSPAAQEQELVQMYGISATLYQRNVVSVALKSEIKTDYM